MVLGFKALCKKSSERLALWAMIVSTNHRHIQTRSFNGYMIHAIKQAPELVFMKLLGIAEGTDMGSLFGSLDHTSSTVKYPMRSWCISRFRYILSFRQDKAELRCWMSVQQWQTMPTMWWHPWQLGNQGRKSSANDPMASSFIPTL